MTIGDRIRLARKELDLTQSDLARALKVKPQTVQQWESGQTAPKRNRIKKLAEILKTSEVWLLTGQGPMRPGRADLILRQHRAPELQEPASEFIPIRKVKIRADAGISGYAIEVDEEYGRPVFFRADWINEKRYRPQQLVAMIVHGRSMEPSLYDGDLIVINLDDTEAREGEVYVLNLDGEIVVKRLRRERGQWIAASDNPDKRRYPDKPIDGEHAQIIGRVVYKQSEVI